MTYNKVYNETFYKKLRADPVRWRKFLDRQNANRKKRLAIETPEQKQKRMVKNKIKSNKYYHETIKNNPEQYAKMRERNAVWAKDNKDKLKIYRQQRTLKNKMAKHDQDGCKFSIHGICAVCGAREACHDGQ